MPLLEVTLHRHRRFFRLREHCDAATATATTDASTPATVVHCREHRDSGSNNSEVTPEQRRELQKREEELHASSLHVPQRLEENENLVLTPFEKNLDIWRQLLRVVEHCDLLVMVVDAWAPLFYRRPDLEANDDCNCYSYDAKKKSWISVAAITGVYLLAGLIYAEFYRKRKRKVSLLPTSINL
ncbi:GTPase LSG1-1-like [Ipomoea triloba]|uniref:GTPase LSG1-1-like n=1 Tax=Ipomoea triloba TaxID=35885 RepID=UPI00125DC804|nr:GTPase LSG1-1-like [Ipomoea triloba]